MRQKLIAAAGTAAALGIGSLVLQRYVAETRGAAIAMVVAWFAIVLVGLMVAAAPRPGLRAARRSPTFAAVLAGTVAIGSVDRLPGDRGERGRGDGNRRGERGGRGSGGPARDRPERREARC